jgi:hypothetical protein
MRDEEAGMDRREVLFGFFVVLAATLNFGYFVGDISDPTVHNAYGLIAAVAVNLLTTLLKLADRTQLGAVHLATSLVADLQLLVALAVLGYAVLLSTAGMTAATTAVVVSLSGGALLANLVSVTILVVDVVSSHRR